MCMPYGLRLICILWYYALVWRNVILNLLISKYGFNLSCMIACMMYVWTSSSITPKGNYKRVKIVNFTTCMHVARKWQYVSDKIHKLHTSLLLNRISASPHFPPPFTPLHFSSFTCVAIDEVSKLLTQSPDTNCNLGQDNIPTSLFKQCSHILLPTITNIISLSISTSIFSDQFESCSVNPHLKNLTMDKDDLGNYVLSLTAHSYQNL